MDKELLQRLWNDARTLLRKGAAPEVIASYLRDESKGQILSLPDLTSKMGAGDLPKESHGVSLLRSLGQGGTFGFQDELAGALDAMTGGDYKSTRDSEREAQKAFHKEHPIQDFVAQLTGGAALPLGAAGKLVTPGATIGQMGITGAKVGGLMGALSGVGTSESPDAEGMAKDAATGGAVGAGVGGALGAVARPVSKGLASVLRYTRDVIHPDAADARAVTELADVIPADTRARMAHLEATRPGMGVLADASPGAAKRLDAAAIVDPEVSDAANRMLDARQAGMGSRLANDVGESAGVPGLDITQIRGAAERAVRPTARKLYGPLEKMYPAVSMSDQTSPLMQALTDPTIESVYRGIAPAEGQAPSFKALQSTLHELQDRASSAFNSGRGNEGAKYRELANTMAAAMEGAMPGFKAVNRGYASTMGTIEGFDLGDKLMSMDSREIPGVLSKLRSKGGQEAVDAARMGALDNLAQRLRSVSENRNAADAIITRAPEYEDRLRQMFPTGDAFERFMQRAEVERIMARARRTVQGNSRTVERGMLAGRAAGESPSAMMQPGGLLRGLDHIIRGDLSQQTAKATGAALLQPAGSPGLDTFLARVQHMQELGGRRSALFNRLAQVAVPGIAGQRTPGLLNDQPQ